jgi:2-polyprenyl-6-hydroxyphenyl methylase/3-demethylubiquinone-9 3-methyltransferase
MSDNPFHQLASTWWDKDGPFHTLHDINPCRLAYVQKFVNLSNIRVLDLGCGGGILAESLAKQGAEVIGIDIEANLIEVAKAHAQSENLAIDYIAKPVAEYEGAPFDLIVCMEMLEHVKEPGQILQQCHRLLKPQGKIFLSTINRSLKAYLELIFMGEYVLKLLPRQTHDYQDFIKPSELMDALLKTGFSFIDLQGMSYHPWRREAKLSRSVEVNYMVYAQKN